jgi:hypothetical protein
LLLANVELPFACGKSGHEPRVKLIDHQYNMHKKAGFRCRIQPAIENRSVTSDVGVVNAQVSPRNCLKFHATEV